MRTPLRILCIVLAAGAAMLQKQGSSATSAAADTRHPISQYCFDNSGFPDDTATETVRTFVPAPTTRALRKGPEIRQRLGDEAPEAFGLPSFRADPERRARGATECLFAGRRAAASHDFDYLRFGVLRI